MSEGLFTLLRIAPEIEADPDNTFSKSGAERLAQIIEAYWRARGKSVFVRIYPSGFHPAIRSARYDVRSDMVGGYPREANAPAQQDAA